MYAFFTEDFAGLSALVWNWIATGVCILFILLLVVALLRYLRGPKLGGRRGKNSRLAVTDATAIGDDRRKLVLVRRDNVEHLLLIGGPSDLVIETNIVKAGASNQMSEPPAKYVQEVAQRPQRKDPALAALDPTRPEPTRPEPTRLAPANEAKPAPIVAPSKPVVGLEPVSQPAVAVSPSVAPPVTAPEPSTHSSKPLSPGLTSATAVITAPIVAAVTDTAPDENSQNASQPVAVAESTILEKTDTKLGPVEEMDALLKEISTTEK